MPAIDLNSLSQAILTRMPTGVQEGIEKLWEALGDGDDVHENVFDLASRAILRGKTWKMIAAQGPLKAVAVWKNPNGDEYVVDEIGFEYYFSDALRVKTLEEAKRIYRPILGRLRESSPTTPEEVTREKNPGRSNFIIMPPE